MKLRHERKHEICFADLLALRTRLSALMDQDSHAVNGCYGIRSLYFDNLADKALREKLDGVSRREKFRLRYYNGDVSFLLLEKKSKYGSLCQKVQTPLTRDAVQALAQGDARLLRESDAPLARELADKMLTQGLRPRTIVDYVREPFVYGPGNVRVTLDYGLRTAPASAGFLDPECATIPAPGAPVILEVKWDAFLPDIIRDAVQVPGVHSAAFSKYAACRAYG